MEADDSVTENSGAKSALSDRLPSWAVGVGFVIVVATLPAIVIVALLNDLSSTQRDVFDSAIGLIAVIIGAGFGLAIQAGKVRAAQLERDLAQRDRVTAVEEERRIKEGALEEARKENDAALEEARKDKNDALEEAEKDRDAALQKAGKDKDAALEKASKDKDEAVAGATAKERAEAAAKHSRTEARVLEVLGEQEGRPKIKQVSANGTRPKDLVKKAVKSDKAYFFLGPKQKPVETVDHDSLLDAVTRAFADDD